MNQEIETTSLMEDKGGANLMTDTSGIKEPSQLATNEVKNPFMAIANWSWLCKEDDDLKSLFAKQKLLQKVCSPVNENPDSPQEINLPLDWSDHGVPLNMCHISPLSKPYPFGLDPTRKFLRSLFNMTKIQAYTTNTSEAAMLKQLRTEYCLCAWMNGLIKKKAKNLRPVYSVSLQLVNKPKRDQVIKEGELEYGPYNATLAMVTDAVITSRKNVPGAHAEEMFLVRVLPSDGAYCEALEKLHTDLQTISDPVDIKKQHESKVFSLSQHSVIANVIDKEISSHAMYRFMRPGISKVVSLMIYAAHIGSGKDQSLFSFFIITDETHWCLTPVMSNVIPLQQVLISSICGDNVFLDTLSMSNLMDSPTSEDVQGNYTQSAMSGMHFNDHAGMMPQMPPHMGSRYPFQAPMPNGMPNMPMPHHMRPPPAHMYAGGYGMMDMDFQQPPTQMRSGVFRSNHFGGSFYDDETDVHQPNHNLSRGLRRNEEQSADGSRFETSGFRRKSGASAMPSARNKETINKNKHPDYALHQLLVNQNPHNHNMPKFNSASLMGPSPDHIIRSTGPTNNFNNYQRLNGPRVSGEPANLLSWDALKERVKNPYGDNHSGEWN